MASLAEILSLAVVLPGFDESALPSSSPTWLAHHSEGLSGLGEATLERHGTRPFTEEPGTGSAPDSWGEPR